MGTRLMAGFRNGGSVTAAAIAAAGGLLGVNNLSDVVSAAASRTSLGLGTAATHATGDFDAAGAAAAVQALALLKASNLSDVANAATSRTSLGLGTAATSAVGDFDAAGAAAAVQALALLKASNLSDVANAATSRTNLGLPSELTLPTGAIAQTYPRNAQSATNVAAPGGTGFLNLVPIILTAGQVLTTATFITGSTGATGPTHQWFALYNSAFALLKVTNDATNVAWAGNTAKTLTFAGGTYTVPTSGIYFLGVVVTVSTTMPNFAGTGVPGSAASIAPALGVVADGGLTTPATAPNPATPGALGAGTNSLMVYAYVS